MKNLISNYWNEALIFHFFFFTDQDRSYRSDCDNDDAISSTGIIGENGSNPSITNNRSPLHYRQASPFPSEATNTRRLHHYTSKAEERIRNGRSQFNYYYNILRTKYNDNDDNNDIECEKLAVAIEDRVIRNYIMWKKFMFYYYSIHNHIRLKLYFHQLLISFRLLACITSFITTLHTWWNPLNVSWVVNIYFYINTNFNFIRNSFQFSSQKFFCLTHKTNNTKKIIHEEQNWWW